MSVKNIRHAMGAQANSVERKNVRNRRPIQLTVRKTHPQIEPPKNSEQAYSAADIALAQRMLQKLKRGQETIPAIDLTELPRPCDAEFAVERAIERLLEQM